MNEGEFRKQLRKLRDLYVETDYLHYDFKIIDEAKKEFPELEEIEKQYELKEDEHNLQKTNVIWMTLATKRKEWFVKWFGE